MRSVAALLRHLESSIQRTDAQRDNGPLERQRQRKRWLLEGIVAIYSSFPAHSGVADASIMITHAQRCCMSLVLDVAVISPVHRGLAQTADGDVQALARCG